MLGSHLFMSDSVKFIITVAKRILKICVWNTIWFIRTFREGKPGVWAGLLGGRRLVPNREDGNMGCSYRYDLT